MGALSYSLQQVALLSEEKSPNKWKNRECERGSMTEIKKTERLDEEWEGWGWENKDKQAWKDKLENQKQVSGGQGVVSGQTLHTNLHFFYILCIEKPAPIHIKHRKWNIFHCYSKHMQTNSTWSQIWIFLLWNDFNMNYFLWISITWVSRSSTLGLKFLASTFKAFSILLITFPTIDSPPCISSLQPLTLLSFQFAVIILRHTWCFSQQLFPNAAHGSWHVRAAPSSQHHQRCAGLKCALMLRNTVKLQRRRQVKAQLLSEQSISNVFSNFFPFSHSAACEIGLSYCWMREKRIPRLAVVLW